MIILLKDFIDGYKRLGKIPSLGHTPLATLSLVKHRLYTHYYADSLLFRHLAVVDVLTRFLEDQLHDLRQRCGVKVVPAADKSIDGARQAIRCDQRSGNIHLICCSFLHYRYLRTDLAFSVAELSQLLGYTETHLRRLTNDYWPYLYQLLIRQEFQVREQQRQTQAELALPAFTGVQLAAQTGLVERLTCQMGIEALSAILITGKPGMGKTTLATALGQSLISCEAAHYAVWLDGRTDDLVDLEAAIVGQLSQPSSASTISLNNILLNLEHVGERLLVVIDNVDGWEQVMTHSWPCLSHCQLVVTAEQPWSAWLGAIVNCPPLSEADARALLGYWYQELPLSARDVSYFWRQSQGNPARLKQLLLSWLGQTDDEQ